MTFQMKNVVLSYSAGSETSTLTQRSAFGQRLWALLLMFVGFSGMAQNTENTKTPDYTKEAPVAYQFYNAAGKPATWQDVVKTASKADIVCFGELHNQSITHWLQLELAKALHQARKGQLAVAYEMWEADIQEPLDRYHKSLAADEEDKELLKTLRAWPNYDTDYKPLGTWAASLGLKQIASNCPRPLARLVSKQGLDTLNGLGSQEKSWLCPLPLVVDTSLPGYRAMIKMMGGGHGMPGFNPANFVYAQAIKDATMAYRTLLLRPDQNLVLHLNGSYHSDNFEGLVHFLPIMARKLNKPEPQVVTISTVLGQPNAKSYTPEADKKASFYLVLPQSAPTSY